MEDNSKRPKTRTACRELQTRGPVALQRQEGSLCIQGSPIIGFRVKLGGTLVG